MDKRVEEITAAVLDMIDSLHQSMIRAHCGVIPTVTWLKKTSVAELIAMLATNDVRFIYVGPPEPDAMCTSSIMTKNEWNRVRVTKVQDTQNKVSEVTGD